MLTHDCVAAKHSHTQSPERVRSRLHSEAPAVIVLRKAAGPANRPPGDE